jgi:TolA-binding protein
MNDPERLHDGAGSPLLRTMLSAAREEQPSDRALQRTLIAISAGTAVLGASAVAGGAGSSTSFGVILKWVGIGATAGLVTAGAAVTLDQRLAPGTASSAISPGPVTQAAPRVELAARPRQPAPATDEAEETETETEPPAGKRPLNTAPSAPAVELKEDDPSLNAEVAALDRARKSLASGQADRALGELGAYARDFPGGRLGPEALFLRMEASAQRGDQASAERAARELLQHHPNSPHAARARAVLGASKIP